MSNDEVEHEQTTNSGESVGALVEDLQRIAAATADYDASPRSSHSWSPYHHMHTHNVIVTSMALSDG